MNLNQDKRDITCELRLPQTQPSTWIGLDEFGQEVVDETSTIEFIVLHNGTVIACDYPECFVNFAYDPDTQSHYAMLRYYTSIAKHGSSISTEWEQYQSRNKKRVIMNRIDNSLHLLNVNHLSKLQLLSMVQMIPKLSAKLGQWRKRKSGGREIFAGGADIRDLLEIYYVYAPWIWRTRLGNFLAHKCQSATHDIDDSLWNSMLKCNNVPRVFDAQLIHDQSAVVCHWCKTGATIAYIFNKTNDAMCNQCFSHCIKLNTILNFLVDFRQYPFNPALARQFFASSAILIHKQYT